MKYRNASYFQHGDQAKIGVLISNLGTPDAATAKALRPYLREFLSDPRVVEFPRLLWWCVLHFIILRFRPARAAKNYQKIWHSEGSPLALHTRRQAQALDEALKQKYGDKVHVVWAMRYGQPSIQTGIQALVEEGVQKLFVLPLYPQYSASTTASTFDAIANDFKQRRWLPELRFSNGYHTEPAYIQALADTITKHWNDNGRSEKLVLSYHGVPQRYLKNGDPYHCYCLQTSRLVAEKLNLDPSEYCTTFQSRFGREPWLQPYTDHSLARFAKEGLKSVDVICPGFSADCLETLEEIEQENRDIFLEAGGERFEYIPALNSQKEHIALLTQLCEKNMHDWLQESTHSETSLTKERYNNCPYNK